MARLKGLNPTSEPEQETGRHALDVLQTEQRDKGSKREQSEKKERLTVHISPDLIERLRDIVYWTPGLTLASFAEEALRAAIEQAEADRGEPFPARSGALKTGRPVR